MNYQMYIWGVEEKHSGPQQYKYKNIKTVYSHGLFKPLCGIRKSWDACATLVSLEGSLGDNCNCKTVIGDQPSVFHKSVKPHAPLLISKGKTAHCGEW